MIRARHVLGVAFTLFVGVVPAVSAAGWQADGDPFTNSLNRCIEDEKQLSVLFLMDESGSVENTDPEDLRVTAAQASLGMLAQLADAEDSEHPVEVSVAVAGFGSVYDQQEGFRELSPSTRPRIAADLSAFADRDDADETDYVRALLGAARDLGSRSGCRLIVWFTDGDYALGSAEVRDDYEARLSEPPVGSPADEYEAAGRQWLCDADDAIVDLIRAEGIYLLTGALNLEPIDEKRFTQRITEGIDDVDQTCGATWREAASLGRFEDAARAEDIIFALIPGPPPVRGRHPFELTYGMTKVFIVVSVPTPAHRAALVSPEFDERRELEYGEDDFRLGSVEVQPEWYETPQAFVLTLDLNPDDTSWVGPWALEFTPDDQGASKILFFGDLRIRPTDAETTAEVGQEHLVEFEVTDRRGSLPAPSDLRQLVPSAIVTTPSGSTTVTGEWASDATSFTIRVAPLRSPDLVEVVPEVAILIPRTDERVPIRGEATTVRFTPAPPPTTTTTMARTAPRVTTDSVRLPVLVGPGSVVGRDAIEIVGGTVDGCAIVESVEVLSVPGESGFSVEVITPGGSDGRCPDGLLVPASTTVLLSIEASSSARGIGTATGRVRITTVTLDGEDPTTHEVALEGPLDLEPLPAWAWVLLILGLGALLAGLVVGAVYWTRRRRRFAIPLNDLGVVSRAITLDYPLDGEAVLAGLDGEVTNDDFIVVGGSADPVRGFELPVEELDLPGKATLTVSMTRHSGGVVDVSRVSTLVPTSTGLIALDLHGKWFLVLSPGRAVDDGTEITAVRFNGHCVLFRDERFGPDSVAFDVVDRERAIRLVEPLVGGVRDRTVERTQVSDSGSTNEPPIVIRGPYDDPLEESASETSGYAPKARWRRRRRKVDRDDRGTIEGPF